MIKLLAIDLDGTLLTSERSPHPESAAAVREAIEAGIHVVFASGRTLMSILPFAKLFNLEGPFVACNGAQVIGRDQSELAFLPLSKEAKQLALDLAAKHDLHLNAYTRTELLYLKPGNWAELYEKRLKTLKGRVATSDEILDQDCSKMLFVGEPEVVARLRPSFQKLIPDGVRIEISEPEYLEFLDERADKGLGLAQIADNLGIITDHIAAIGDYSNDVGMLRFAGTSGAVANANAEARAAADFHVASNNDGGVAEFIRRHVFGAS